MSAGSSDPANGATSAARARIHQATARLRRPELAPVVDELARRFGNGEVPVALTLRDLSAATRRAIADLLGSERLVGTTGRLSIARLLTSLHLDAVDELRLLVEELRGPLADRRADRQAAIAARNALWAWVERDVARLRVAKDPAVLLPWVESLRASGIRGGVETYRGRLARVLSVLRGLPADGVGLVTLATDRAADPHALAYGSAVGTLTLDALACVADVPRPDDAESSRSLWERFGVVPDALSSTVLAIGVPGGSESLGRPSAPGLQLRTPDNRGRHACAPADGWRRDCLPTRRFRRRGPRNNSLAGATREDRAVADGCRLVRDGHEGSGRLRVAPDRQSSADAVVARTSRCNRASAGAGLRRGNPRHTAHRHDLTQPRDTRDAAFGGCSTITPKTSPGSRDPTRLMYACRQSLDPHPQTDEDGVPNSHPAHLR